MTKEATEQEAAPMYLVYKSKPRYFTLATKIYRHHMQVAPNVNDVASDAINAPVARAVQRHQAQYESHHHKANPTFPASSMSMQQRRRRK